MTTRRLKAVVDMATDVGDSIAMHHGFERTAKLLQRRGAQSLQTTTVGVDGLDWDGVLPAQIRARVIAQFADGHQVVGDSDQYDVAALADVLALKPERWTQACARLTEQFEL